MPVEARPPLRRDLAGHGALDVPLAARPELDRDPLFGPGTHAFADIVAVDDKVRAVRRSPPDQHMNMRIIG
ncbi:MAG: hypothetical protein WCY11_02155, partial [Novosphingobium sp.]